MSEPDTERHRSPRSGGTAREEGPQKAARLINARAVAHEIGLVFAATWLTILAARKLLP